jgi:hypothetical protein
MKIWRRGSESNTPRPVRRADNGFEDRGGHQAPITLRQLIALDVRRALCSRNRNPPPYVGGYVRDIDSKISSALQRV